MKHNKIASILNNAIMKNSIGGENGVTVAEDLANIIDVGVLLSNMTADAVKNFIKDVISGVRTEVVSRMYEGRKFRFFRDSNAYGGVLSRIMASDDLNAMDSHLINLIDDGTTSYHDGKFYGITVSDRVYEKTDSFKVAISMSQDNYNMYFESPEAVSKFIGLIENTEERTIARKLEALEKRLIVEAVRTAYNGNRVVNTVTAFNTFMGNTGSDVLTIADIHADRDLTAYYNDFCKKTIAELIDYVKEPNKKYNDGTVLTFSPTEKVACVLLTQWATNVKYISDPIEFNNAEMVAYETVPAWQNSGLSMLPSFATASSITVPNATSGQPDVTIDNIVGVIYDVDGIGVTNKANKVTVEEVGAEGFRTFFHHVANNYFIDTRLSCVVLCEE